MRAFQLVVLFLLAAVGLLGCEEAYEPGPPADWASESTAGTLRWWQSSVDTSEVFRDLESLRGMGILSGQQTYASTEQLALRTGSLRTEFGNAVKRSLVALYRSAPEVVDSLFEAYARPKLADVDLSGDLMERVEDNKRVAYDAVRKHFREPRPALELGTDVPVIYPDSLRAFGGDVRVQAYVDAEGVPVALELIEGVHPVLDDLAMKATTQMRWRPAYVLRGSDWEPIPSWVRFRVRFNQGGG